MIGQNGLNDLEQQQPIAISKGKEQGQPPIVESIEEEQHRPRSNASALDDHSYASPMPSEEHLQNPPQENQLEAAQQQDKVIPPNDDPDEVAKRHFGIIDNMEIAISAKKFEQLIRNLGCRKKKVRN